MNYSIFNSFPSAIVVIENEAIVYKNNNFIEIVGDININQLPNEIKQFRENEDKGLIVLNNLIYYSRKIKDGDKEILDIQSVDCSKINVLINNLSKEIRSPLHGIAGMVNILRNTTLNTQEQEYMDIIQECSTDLLHIINNVSDYVKITENKFKLKNKSLDLNESIDETYNILKAKVDKKDLIMKYNIDAFSQKYIGDYYRIQQILIHVLTNSIEYTSKGNIELNVKKHSSEPEFDAISIEIKDTGIGIKKEDYDNLFKPFCKTRNTLSNRIGLSLVITKYICESMKGSITIDSKYNKGTTVNMIIKLKRNESISDIEFQNKVKNKKVLIINEDNQERYDLSSFVLKNNMKVVATPLITEASTVYLANDYKFDYIIISNYGKNKNEVETFKQKAKLVNECVIIEINETPDKLNIQRPIEFEKLKTMIYDNSIEHITKKEKEVLIVEDQVSNQIVISKYLNSMGITKIDIANNGEEAIRKVLSKNKKYDLILMDIMMPVMDGIEATKGIMKIDSDNVIIGITADAIRDVNECIKIGMKDIIIKPVTFKDFKITCEKYINI